MSEQMIELLSMEPASNKYFPKSLAYMGIGNFFKLYFSWMYSFFSCYMFIIEKLENAEKHKTLIIH